MVTAWAGNDDESFRCGRCSIFAEGCDRAYEDPEGLNGEYGVGLGHMLAHCLETAEIGYCREEKVFYRRLWRREGEDAAMTDLINNVKLIGTGR